jgi:hypothetical protein
MLTHPQHHGFQALDEHEGIEWRHGRAMDTIDRHVVRRGFAA